jgi:hypothetical protein
MVDPWGAMEIQRLFSPFSPCFSIFYMFVSVGVFVVVAVVFMLLVQ